MLTSIRVFCYFRFRARHTAPPMLSQPGVVRKGGWKRGTTSQGKELVMWRGGFVTVGGVGFKGDFGVGCADSSTLSSVPRSTGGYASLHTFTSVHVHAHTYARRSRNWLARGGCGYPCALPPFCPSFFPFSRLLCRFLRSRPPRTHAHEHAHA